VQDLRYGQQGERVKRDQQGDQPDEPLGDQSDRAGGIVLHVALLDKPGQARPCRKDVKAHRACNYLTGAASRQAYDPFSTRDLGPDCAGLSELVACFQAVKVLLTKMKWLCSRTTIARSISLLRNARPH
jgi:hypothetical protein